MNKFIGLALIVIGVILLYYGFQEGESLASQAKEVVTGSPTERSITLMIAGVICAAVGAGVMSTRSRRS